MASETPKPVTPKPTTSAKAGGGNVAVTPAGAGSVGAPVETKGSVRQPVTATLPQQNVKAPDTKTQFELPPAVYSPQLLESVIYDIERYLDWYRQSQIQK